MGGASLLDLHQQQQQNLQKCGQDRLFVASASALRRTAASEWSSWTLVSCPSGGAVLSVQNLQQMRRQSSKKSSVSSAFGTQGTNSLNK
jgi:hypothetical protein